MTWSPLFLPCHSDCLRFCNACEREFYFLPKILFANLGILFDQLVLFEWCVLGYLSIHQWFFLKANIRPHEYLMSRMLNPTEKYKRLLPWTVLSQAIINEAQRRNVFFTFFLSSVIYVFRPQMCLIGWISDILHSRLITFCWHRDQWHPLHPLFDNPTCSLYCFLVRYTVWSSLPLVS